MTKPSEKVLEILRALAKKWDKIHHQWLDDDIYWIECRNTGGDILSVSVEPCGSYLMDYIPRGTFDDNE